MRESDFHLTLDRAAGLLVDVTSAVRSSSRGPLPQPHRRLLEQAARKLEGAQDDLFIAQNNPWKWQPPKQPQLALPV